MKVRACAMYATVATGLMMCPAALVNPLLMALSFIIFIIAGLAFLWTSQPKEKERE